MTPEDSGSPAGVADSAPLARRREQRAWYWYDWANSAYVTTVATVLFAPYLTSIAERAACGAPGTVEAPCRADLSVLGVLSVSPGSLVFYVVTVATITSALVLPPVGAAADRSPRKKQLMAGFAWAGSVMAFYHSAARGAWPPFPLRALESNNCGAAPAPPAPCPARPPESTPP